ncbi:unnamed protein product [Gordionus sp. m RMFG-2023]|uniref:transcription factor IIIB 90 kDa subunit-like n=1 Tax=Gordionus sp. m RMFG-2023 TaxID=3053472 RepID=UPI0030E43803
MSEIKSSKRSSLTCPNCGSADIDTEPSRGDSVCINCGSVVEDTLIVSEIGFQEDNHGGISAIGTFINEDGIIHTSSRSRNSNSFATALLNPSSMSADNAHGNDANNQTSAKPNFVSLSGSTQHTLTRARSDLTRLAARLKINSTCLETALNFYKLALFKGFMRGRRQAMIYGALLYLVCRLENTSHLLLDFSDALTVSVYDLGKYYLKLSAELCINAPVTDPALYIPRFAQKLELGKKTHEVVMTSLRLISRMKKDWLHAGRRPSGLCGAALLVAARLHNFNRTTRQLVNIVRVRETTLKKRLKEFAATPSASLSLTEFFEIDLEEECDPPSFAKSKANSKTQFLDNLKFAEVSKEIKSLQQQIEEELTELRVNKKNRRTSFKSNQSSVDSCNDIPSVNQNDDMISTFDETSAAYELINTQIIGNLIKAQDNEPKNINSEDQNEPNGENNQDISDHINSETDEDTFKMAESQTSDLIKNNENKLLNSGGKVLGLKYLPTIESLDLISTRGDDRSQFVNPFEKSLNSGDIAEVEPELNDPQSIVKEDEQDLLDLTGIDDEELDGLLMSPDEVILRTLIWENEYGEFMKQREAKQASINSIQTTVTSELKLSKDVKNILSAAGNLKPGAEAGQRIFRGKKVSSKINYDVLKGLGFKGSHLADRTLWNTIEALKDAESKEEVSEINSICTKETLLALKNDDNNEIIEDYLQNSILANKRKEDDDVNKVENVKDSCYTSNLNVCGDSDFKRKLDADDYLFVDFKKSHDNDAKHKPYKNTCNQNTKHAEAAEDVVMIDERMSKKKEILSLEDKSVMLIEEEEEDEELLSEDEHQINPSMLSAAQLLAQMRGDDGEYDHFDGQDIDY